MSRFGFCGPSYQSLSPNADAQKCTNWILERIESDSGKGAFALYDREGLVLFSLGGAGPVRGQFTTTASPAPRTFAVDGSTLYEILANGNRTNLATVINDGGAVYFADNSIGTQVALSSGGTIYVITLPAATVTTIPAATFSQGPVARVSYIDGFFVALLANQGFGGSSPAFFYNSALEDATTWSGGAAGANQVSVFSGNVLACMEDQRQLLLLGSSRGVIYYNSGATTTPLVPINGGNVSNGIGAPDSLMRLDNTWFWLDNDVDKGPGIFRRYQSGGPGRVSNHAVETIWQGYPKLTDCIGFSYQNNGHSFAVLYFPSANAGKGATWVYDVATGLWHDRDNWIPASATSQAYLARCHTFNFGKHLVGDWNSGNIYSLSSTVISDNGGPIRRVRRAPHISAEQKRIYHHELQVDLEVGLGPIPPLQGTASPTQIILQAPNASLWALTVNDNGTLQVAPGTGAAQALILNDPTNAASWQAKVSNAGILSTTSVALNTTNPQFQVMVSNGGGLTYRLLVTLGGLLQTENQGIIPRGPQIMLRFSDNAAKTWSNEYARDCGQAGEYTKRVRWTRLGQSRDRIYELAATDPVPFRITEAYLQASGAATYTPQERLVKELSKRA